MTQQAISAVASQETMRLSADPAMTQWQLHSRASTDRTALLQRANDHAKKLGSGVVDVQQLNAPLIATGHQAWLWHPGILAKDLAMAAAAKKSHSQMLHIVVDQDVHEALTLDLPIKEGDSLRVEKVKLAHELAEVPAACQAAVDGNDVVANLQKARETWGEKLCVNLDALINAWRDLPAFENLASQIAAVEHRLMLPFTGPVPMAMATDLMTLPMFKKILQQMLDDAPRCVQLYNRAVATVPEARMTQLIEERERVELPLWALAWNGARLRLFADLASSKAALSLEDGTLVDEHELIENTGKISPKMSRDSARKSTLALAPRALLLTAIMRSVGCDLFIHGKGGAIYDRITETWWQAWMKQTLAPLAMVSADVFLPLDVPVAQSADVQRAQWWMHHLPHNVDRALGWSDERVEKKNALISKLRRKASHAEKQADFRALHELNATWLREQDHLKLEAVAQLQRAQTGLHNRRITSRRDWCFALYPAEMIASLKNKFDMN